MCAGRCTEGCRVSAGLVGVVVLTLKNIYIGRRKGAIFEYVVHYVSVEGLPQPRPRGQDPGGGDVWAVGCAILVVKARLRA